MAQLRYKTRGDISPRGLPRVYFSCHPEDRKGYFEDILEEILSACNCAVYYYEDEPEQDEDYDLNLGRMNLMVMPVTSRLLHMPNRAMDVEFSYAVNHHIPVLPLLQEQGLEKRFNEKCGDLQFLDKHINDPTALPYADKLEKYLKAVLVGDGVAARVRAAFDAYIFLSYRKKDRKLAQELMHLIHRSPLCRRFAIWYDEFLTPGENFNDSIREALDKSGLFVLAVTPNLVNEINYIMTTEYPMAKKAGKPILPSEMEKTDPDALRSNYDGIPNSVDPADEERFTKLLLDALCALVKRENDNDPVHNYLIGLAYLAGIDVEVDHAYAVKLITAAAETGLTEAMEKLVSMYENGEGVKRDYRAAVQWRQRLSEAAELQYLQEGTRESGRECFLRLIEWGDALHDLRELGQAKTVYERLCFLCVEMDERWKSDATQRDLSVSYEKLGHTALVLNDIDGAMEWFSAAMEISRSLAAKSGSANRDLQVAYHTMGEVCRRQGKIAEARKWYNRSLAICAEQVKTGNVTAIRDMEVCYGRLGGLTLEEGDYPKAKEFYLDALKLSQRLADIGDPIYRRDFAVSCNRLGDVLLAMGEHFQAKVWYTRGMGITVELAQSATVDSLRDLSFSYEKMGKICYALRNFAQAKQWYQKALDISLQLAKTGSPDTVRDLAVGYADMSRACAALGQIEEARKWSLCAVGIKERLAENASPEALRDLGISYFLLGELGRAERSLGEARKWYLKCADVRQKLVGKSASTDVLRGLADVSGRLGELYQAEKNLFEARNWYSSQQRILLRLPRTEDIKTKLVKNYDALAMILLDQNRVAQAENSLSKGIDIARELAQENGNPDNMETLALLCYKLGRLLGSKGLMKEALAIFVALNRKYPSIHRYNQRAQLIQSNLERLV